MAHEKLGYKDNAFNLPDNTVPPNCDDGAIWTNITADELYVCLKGISQSVPHSGYHRCILSKSANQPIGNIYTDVIFDQETLDVGDMHDNVINNPRALIHKTGIYFVFYKVEFEGAANTNYSTRIRVKDAGSLLRFDRKALAAMAGNAFLHCGDFFQLTAGDYLTLQAQQSSPSDKDIIKENTSFSVLRIF